jgi:hypothetical protein
MFERAGATWTSNTGPGTVHLLHGGNTKIATPPCNFCTNHVRPSAINVLTHIRPYNVHKHGRLPTSRTSALRKQNRPDFIRSFKLTPLRRQPRGPANLTDPTSAAPAELLLYFQRFEPFSVACLAPPGTNGSSFGSSKQLLPRRSVRAYV